jgi:hypothetical protein
MIPMHSPFRHEAAYPGQSGGHGDVRPRCAHSAKRECEEARTEQNKSCNGYCEKTEGGDLITHAKS